MTHTKGPHTHTHTHTYAVEPHTGDCLCGCALHRVYHRLVFRQSLQLCLTSCSSTWCCGDIGRKDTAGTVPPCCVVVVKRFADPTVNQHQRWDTCKFTAEYQIMWDGCWNIMELLSLSHPSFQIPLLLAISKHVNAIPAHSLVAQPHLSCFYSLFLSLSSLSLLPLSDVLCMSAFIKQDDLSCRCETKVMTSPRPSTHPHSPSLFLCLWSKERRCLSLYQLVWLHFTSDRRG